MGKRIEKALVFAIVLLYPMSLAGVAEAGFYDWLVSKNQPNNLLVSSPIIDGGNTSFNKIFSWDNRKPENIDPIPSIIEEQKEKPKPELKVIKTYSVRATAYSSTPDQTDDTPFITANGTYVKDGIIAANFYVDGYRVPFGTLVRIPEIYGEKV